MSVLAICITNVCHNLKRDIALESTWRGYPVNPSPPFCPISTDDVPLKANI